MLGKGPIPTEAGLNEIEETPYRPAWTEVTKDNFLDRDNGVPVYEDPDMVKLYRERITHCPAHAM